jgi:hypothetical protein
MRTRAIGALLLCFVAAAAGGQAQSRSPVFFPSQPTFYAPFAVDLYPGINVPLGRDADYFGVGGTLDIEVAYRLPFLPRLAATAGGGYSIIPLDYGSSVSLLRVGAGGKLILDLLPRLSAEAWLAGDTSTPC